MIDLNTYNIIRDKIINIVDEEIRQFVKDYLNTHMCRHLYNISLIEESIHEINNTKSTLTILDVGPFPGLITAYFSQKGHRVVALEYPRKDLDLIKQVYDYYNVDLIYFDLSKIRPDNYYDKSSKFINNFGRFDLILMFEVIEHIPTHPVPIMKFIANILESKGLLLFSTPNMFYYINRYKFLRGIEPFPLYSFDLLTTKGHFKEYSERELMFVFNELPLKVLKKDIFNYDDFCKKINVNKTGISFNRKEIAKKVLEKLIYLIGKSSSTKRYIYFKALKIMSII